MRNPLKQQKTSNKNRNTARKHSKTTKNIKQNRNLYQKTSTAKPRCEKCVLVPNKHPEKKFQILLPFFLGGAVGVLQKCVTVPKKPINPQTEVQKTRDCTKKTQKTKFSDTTSFGGGGKCMSGSSVCEICFFWFFCTVTRCLHIGLGLFGFFGTVMRFFCTSVWGLFGFFSTVTHCLHRGLEVAWFFRYSHAFVAPPSGSVLVLLACWYNNALAATGLF